MARALGCVLITALAVSAWTGCKSDDKDKDKDKPGAGKTAPTSADLIRRCDEVAKSCGDTDKRVEKIAAECKQAAQEQVTSGCTAQAMAAYDCYVKELCGKGEQVWALDDLRVLSERHAKCVTERDASRTCVGN
jgi:hypothetical protein